MFKLAENFKDNMILPADTEIQFWGEADYPVTVSVDYVTNVVWARDGKFTLTLAGHKSGGPYTLFAESGGKVIKLQNVYFGDAEPLCAPENR